MARRGSCDGQPPLLGGPGVPVSDSDPTDSDHPGSAFRFDAGRGGPQWQALADGPSRPLH